MESGLKTKEKRNKAQAGRFSGSGTNMMRNPKKSRAQILRRRGIAYFCR
jgi:hypothetical protein